MQRHVNRDPAVSGSVLLGPLGGRVALCGRLVPQMGRGCYWAIGVVARPWPVSLGGLSLARGL